jgi:hypothetical protein
MEFLRCSSNIFIKAKHCCQEKISNGWPVVRLKFQSFSQVFPSRIRATMLLRIFFVDSIFLWVKDPNEIGSSATLQLDNWWENVSKNNSTTMHG